MTFRTVAALAAIAALAACQTTGGDGGINAANGRAVAGASCGGVTGDQRAVANATEPKSGRQFFLEYPCDLKPNEKVTVVLNLHGAGSSGGWQRQYFPIGEYAQKYRLVVATPTAATSTPMRTWQPAADDQYLQDVTDLLFSEFGKTNVKAFWLAGHSQGGATSHRIICSDFFAARVDGFISLAGGRVGMGRTATTPPTCDFSHIFETGDQDSAGVAGVPTTSPLADRFKCGPRARKADVVDTVAGKVFDGRTAASGRPNRAGWGGPPAPGTAEVYVFDKCADNRVVADVIREKKGHTEGLEPKVTEEIAKLMVSAKGGNAQDAT